MKFKIFTQKFAFWTSKELVFIMPQFVLVERMESNESQILGLSTGFYLKWFSQKSAAGK